MGPVSFSPTTAILVLELSFWVRISYNLAMARPKSETEFKRWYRGQLKDWSDTVEQARGSVEGFPDIVVLVGSFFGPVEVKVGTVKGDMLFPEKVRPAQIGWLDRYTRAGGIARLVVGVWAKGKWSAYMKTDVSKPSLQGWRKGWPLSSLQVVTEEGRLLVQPFPTLAPSSLYPTLHPSATSSPTPREDWVYTGDPATGYCERVLP